MVEKALNQIQSILEPEFGPEGASILTDDLRLGISSYEESESSASLVCDIGPEHDRITALLKNMRDFRAEIMRGLARMELDLRQEIERAVRVSEASMAVAVAARKNSRGGGTGPCNALKGGAVERYH